MKRSTELKRTPFKRKAPLRMAPTDAKATVSPRECDVCTKAFFPARTTQVVCSPKCATKKVKLARKAQQEADREHRRKLAASKPLAHWHELTKTSVHALIRLRDHDDPCISCGTRTTACWQAGHYLSVGAHPEIRYHPDNINKQCLRCNVNLSGNQAMYRLGLVAKIGAARVEALEGPHPPAKHTREALAGIRKEANAKVRQLKKEKGL